MGPMAWPWKKDEDVKWEMKNALEESIQTVPNVVFSTQFLCQAICTYRDPRRDPSNRRFCMNMGYDKYPTLPGIELSHNLTEL